MKKKFEFKDIHGTLIKEGDYLRFPEPLDTMWNGIAKWTRYPIGKVVKRKHTNERSQIYIETVVKGLAEDIVDILKDPKYWSKESIEEDPYYHKIGREIQFHFGNNFHKPLEIFEYRGDTDE